MIIEPDNTAMLAANVNHLRWLESYTKQRYDLWLNGVDILKCFTYDLVQFFNNQWISEHVSAQSEPV